MSVVGLAFATRTISKPLWKRLWRQSRIINREIASMCTDVAIFGVGGVRIGADVPDLIRRVEPAELWLPAADGQP